MPTRAFGLGEQTHGETGTQFERLKFIISSLEKHDVLLCVEATPGAEASELNRYLHGWSGSDMDLGPTAHTVLPIGNYIKRTMMTTGHDCVVAAVDLRHDAAAMDGFGTDGFPPNWGDRAWDERREYLRRRDTTVAGEEPWIAQVDAGEWGLAAAVIRYAEHFPTYRVIFLAHMLHCANGVYPKEMRPDGKEPSPRPIRLAGSHLAQHFSARGGYAAIGYVHSAGWIGCELLPTAVLPYDAARSAAAAAYPEHVYSSPLPGGQFPMSGRPCSTWFPYTCAAETLTYVHHIKFAIPHPYNVSQTFHPHASKVPFPALPAGQTLVYGASFDRPTSTKVSSAMHVSLRLERALMYTMVTERSVSGVPSPSYSGVRTSDMAPMAITSNLSHRQIDLPVWIYILYGDVDIIEGDSADLTSDGTLIDVRYCHSVLKLLRNLGANLDGLAPTVGQLNGTTTQLILDPEDEPAFRAELAGGKGATLMLRGPNIRSYPVGTRVWIAPNSPTDVRQWLLVTSTLPLYDAHDPERPKRRATMAERVRFTPRSLLGDGAGKWGESSADYARIHDQAATHKDVVMFM